MRRLFAHLMMETAAYLRFYMMNRVVNSVFHKENTRLLQAPGYQTTPEFAV